RTRGRSRSGTCRSRRPSSDARSSRKSSSFVYPSPAESVRDQPWPSAFESGCRFPNRQSAACFRPPAPPAAHRALRTKRASPGRLRCVRFRAPMAREVTFPRTRHVALSGVEQAAEAKAAGSEAILVPIRVATEATPPAGVPLPPPAQPGAPGVPEKGALPPPPRPPGPAARTEAPPPHVPVLPWVVSVDVSEPASDVDRCRALDGTPAAVRCPSSLEGREAAGHLAESAALAGEAVLLQGLDRWYRMGPEGSGYCKSCGFALIE